MPFHIYHDYILATTIIQPYTIGRNKLNNMEFNIPWWKFNLTLSDLFQFLLSDLSCNLPFTSGD